VNDSSGNSPVWVAVRECERETCINWLKEFFPQETMEIALAAYVSAVSTTVERRKGGQISVISEVICTNPRFNYNCWFKLQRQGKLVYVRDRKASS
jgi:phage terminase large subunit